MLTSDPLNPETPSRAIAHSKNSRGYTQLLTVHLQNVSTTAARFGAKFDVESLAKFLGLCHDLGKFHPDFQDYITGGRPKGPDHKLSGALIVRKHWPDLALVIEGHHGGLPCRGEFKTNKLHDERLLRTAELALQIARGSFKGLEAFRTEAVCYSAHGSGRPPYAGVD